MKVKIGEDVFDSEDQPIMVILSEEDQINIHNMPISATSYTCFNAKKHTRDEVKKWMRDVSSL